MSTKLGLRARSKALAALLALSFCLTAQATSPNVVTRLVIPGGTATTVKAVPGLPVTFEVRIDAPDTMTVGSSYRLSQTSPVPPPGGYFAVTGRSFAGSPYNDPNLGAPDATVLAAPGNRLDPASDVNLGTSAFGLTGVAPANNILATTVTLTSNPSTPFGTYRIQTTSGASFVTVVGPNPQDQMGVDVSMSTAYIDIMVGQSLAVTTLGGGTGTVTSSDNPQTISCPGACSSIYPGATLTLTANPNKGSVFTGWIGSCTGTGTCTVTVDEPVAVSATFAKSTVGTHILDIDGNGQYDALTDGLLVIRYMFGLTGSTLIDGAVGAGATRTDAAKIQAYLDDIEPYLDVNGDGSIDALSDGMLVLRYLLGVTGTSLTEGTITAGSTRTTPAAVQAYMDALMP